MEHVQDTATEWRTATARGFRVACTSVDDSTWTGRSTCHVVDVRTPAHHSLTGRVARSFRDAAHYAGVVGGWERVGVDDARPH